MKKFLDKNKIIFEHQYGFQKGKSTVHAVLDLINNITESLDKGLITAVVFLDFAKAFDTVNLDILLEKLHHYGFRGIALNWFKSFLMNRQQVVSINGNIFSNLLVHSGVPQGSVLGPVLFLLYINDIPNSVNILKPFLFADDTSLYYSSSNIKDLEITINNDLEQIQEWLLCNKLSLNIKKSNFVTFHSRQKSYRDHQSLK